MSCERKSKYTKEDRLADVIALLQVLAFHRYAHRTEAKLAHDLPDKPLSAETWLLLAKEHQEFFRVVESANYPISLVLRHSTSSGSDGRPPLLPDQAEALINTAIQLHDKQIKRQQMGAIYFPLWVAAASFVAAVVVATIKC